VAGVHALALGSLGLLRVDSTPSFLLLPFFLELLIDLSLMVSVGGHVLTNDGEDSLGALFRPVDLEHGIFVFFCSLTISTVVEVLPDGTLESWANDRADSAAITFNVLVDVRELGVVEAHVDWSGGLSHDNSWLSFLNNAGIDLRILLVDLIHLIHQVFDVKIFSWIGRHLVLNDGSNTFISHLSEGILQLILVFRGGVVSG
jgi:hypothetical protein